MTEQTPYEIEEQNIRFDVVEFAENPEPRCPCILLLDCSGSMNGKPIQWFHGRNKTKTSKNWYYRRCGQLLY